MLDQGEIFMIHDLHRQGLTITAIAGRTGLDRKTVRKYLRRGLDAPAYGPRASLPGVLHPYHDYLRQRLQAYPELTAARLWRELRELGYPGGITIVKDFVRVVRPPRVIGYEHRFETPPGQQAQVDFAQFKVIWPGDPGQVRVIWLFNFVLGYSRYLFSRYVWRQDLETLVRCHLAAFAAIGGVPREILYDRMKTAVVGEDGDGRPVFNATLQDLARHFGFVPRACRPYRAQTKGKVERPTRYVRQDFFLGCASTDLDDLNSQFTGWQDTVANQRVHGTTRRPIAGAFAEDQAALLPLPALPFASVLRLERRVTRDGMVSVGGNQYSVPDTTQQRVVEVQTLAEEVRIYDGGRLVAVHEPLTGRGGRRLAAGHRRFPPPGNARVRREAPAGETPGLPGARVAVRPLAVYAAIAGALAGRSQS